MKRFFRAFGLAIQRIPDTPQKTFDEVHQLLVMQPQPIIFDVGANEGQSIDRFRILFPNSTIHSFEPLPRECQALKEQYASDNTLINNIGLGSSQQKRKFYTNFHSPSSSFVKLNLQSLANLRASKAYETPVHQHVAKEVHGDVTGEIEVDVSTVDLYIKDHAISRIDILKIDTQGFENEVLKGAEQALLNKTIQIVELEMIVGDVYESRVTFRDIEQYLVPYGYRLFAITKGGSIIDDPFFGFDVIYTLEHYVEQATMTRITRVSDSTV